MGSIIQTNSTFLGGEKEKKEIIFDYFSKRLACFNYFVYICALFYL